MALPENPIASSKLKSIALMVSHEYQVIKVPPIDFIFGEPRWIFTDHDLLVRRQHKVTPEASTGQITHTSVAKTPPTYFYMEEQIASSFQVMSCECRSKEMTKVCAFDFRPRWTFSELVVGFSPMLSPFQLAGVEFSQEGEN
eukprot:TRINITY_DN15789_c2_g2_i6.p1 TRINITY_DN15789_c2_g2~~TRINITY_DN15789_c2_g2_i6.p1  ORF type:complete len:158 (-),score=19.36 TRINITY_DN15789_c2_g2_i6:2-427(-)